MSHQYVTRNFPTDFERFGEFATLNFPRERKP
jgi:hypothetical protein